MRLLSQLTPACLCLVTLLPAQSPFQEFGAYLPDAGSPAFTGAYEVGNTTARFDVRNARLRLRLISSLPVVRASLRALTTGGAPGRVIVVFAATSDPKVWTASTVLGQFDQIDFLNENTALEVERPGNRLVHTRYRRAETHSFEGAGTRGAARVQVRLLAAEPIDVLHLRTEVSQFPDAQDVEFFTGTPSNPLQGFGRHRITASGINEDVVRAFVDDILDLESVGGFARVRSSQPGMDVDVPLQRSRESIVSYAFGFQNPSAGAAKSIVETRACDDRVDIRARTFGAAVDQAEFQDGFFGAGPGQTIFSIPRTGPDSFEANDVQLDANQTQALWNVNFLQTRFSGPAGPAAELAGFAVPTSLPVVLGAGCPGSAGHVPFLDAWDPITATDSTANLSVVGPPNTMTWLAFGFDSPAGGPLDLTMFGFDNCYMDVEPIAIEQRSSDTLGVARFTLSVPYMPFAGEVRMQAYQLDGGVSNALLATVF